MRGEDLLGERAKGLEARRHPEQVGVYAADIWEDSYAFCPERSVTMLQS